MPTRVPLAQFELGRTPGTIDVLARAETEPPLDLPLVAIVGASPGPLVCAAAGVHGDEYEGPRALWELARDLPASSLTGSVVLLPVCNPWAFAAGRRATPEVIDGLNLARSFPGDPRGRPTQRLAAGLLEFVTRHRPALFVDLHSGGIGYHFLPVVGYRRGLGDPARSQAAARAFGVSHLWELRDHPGTFNSETARLGILTVGTEMSGMGGCLDEDVAATRDGVLNLLRWLGMLRDRPAPQMPGPFWRTTDLPAPSAGCAVIDRGVGEPVREGSTVARVLSPLGEALGDARAPHDGRVWVTRHLRTIEAGETLAAVARPVDDDA
ncbi:MAG TPA: succinylglutamate desuccinylase/aspartoacylase family protein [bacterium]|nr:succinylglutamate desuccinylase/aspartoacylase family protein [bacterium]